MSVAEREASHTLPMDVDVVPQLAEVEVEDVPADAFAALGDDRRGVANEHATVDGTRRLAGAAGIGDGVRLIAGVRPDHRRTRPPSPQAGHKRPVGALTS